MNPNKTDAAGGASLSDAGFDACRAAFVAKIKDENFYQDCWARSSLKAHWSGARGGFADDIINKRWRDFLAGWMASNG